MSTLVGPLLNSLLTLCIGQCIRYYPLQGKWRVSLQTLFIVYALVFAAECAVFMYFRRYFAGDYVGNQVFKTIVGLCTMLLPFFLTKRSFFQNVFLLSMVMHYVMVIFGFGNYIELTRGGAWAVAYPYFVCNAVVIALSLPLLPLMLRVLRRTLGLWPGDALIWKFIWLLPALSAVYCMASGNILMGTQAATGVFFLAGRFFLSAGMVITCFLLAKMLKQEAGAAALTENARMMEAQLALQREQYGSLTENAEAEKAARHDLRHQLAVIQRYNEAGEHDKLGDYLGELTGSFPAAENAYCENYAVNAVICHHLAAAAGEGIRLDIKLDLPEQTGGAPAMDLCIIVGNLLENALEACRRMEQGERFIRARSRVEDGYLSLLVENSFDGLCDEQNGIYLSGKRVNGADVPREGVGLSSVKAVCEKHGGLARFEPGAGVWKASALVYMGEEV